MATTRLCKIPECDKPVRGKGYCRIHYKRLLRHGDPNTLLRQRNGQYETWIKEHRSWSSEGCLIWPYWRDPQGYGPSRRMCIEAHGEPEDAAMHAAHSCGKGHEGCVHPRHLRWATRHENQNEMVLHGNSLRGVKNPNCRLTEDIVRSMRQMASSMTHLEIAGLVGVSQSTATRAISGRTWAWLT